MSGSRALLGVLAAVCALPLVAGRGASAATAGPVPETPASGGGGFTAPFDFSSTTEDRVFLDVPLTKQEGSVAALLLAGLSLTTPSAIRSATVHLHSGGGWWSAPVQTSSLKGELRVPFGVFEPEDKPGPIENADLARVSLWRSPAPGAGELRFASVSLAPPATVAILRGTEATAPGETALANDMAARCARLLARAGILFDTLPDTALADPAALQGRQAVLLPYNRSLSAKHLATLRAFVRDGGYVVAFYNASAGLSQLLGLDAPHWEGAAKGDTWPSIQIGTRRLPYSTANRICPVPHKGATVEATWVSPDGKTSDDPAVVSTAHGALFAHVPPLAYPAAQELLRNLLQGHGYERGKTEGPGAPGGGLGGAFPRPLPIIAAWARNTTDMGAAKGLTTIYLLSGSRAAGSVPGALAPGGVDGSAIHTWLPCLHSLSGRWLSPEKPAHRVAVLARVREAARANPAGLHFDYLRTPEGVAVTPEATAAVTALLREMAETARKEEPGIVLSAAVFPTPTAAAAHNQDWPTWVKEGLVDYVTPMLYYDDPADFRAALAQCVAAVPADRIVAGIGTGADESQVMPEAVKEEIAAATEAGCRGVSFYSLDEYLLELLSTP